MYTVANSSFMVILYSTKYMGGHTDLTAGCVSFANKELMKKAHANLIMLGSSLVH